MMLPYIKQAWLNLWAYKLRSMLAVLGVLVGTASVVALVSAGQMATAHALAEFKDLGTNLLAVSITGNQATGEVPANPGNVVVPSDKQLALLQRTSTGIAAVAAYTVVYSPVLYHEQLIAQSVVGVSDAFWRILTIKAGQGRLTTALDQQQALCVLGHEAQQKLLQKGVFLPVKKTVQVLERACPVLGTIAESARSYFIFADLNQAVMMPYATLAGMIGQQPPQVFLIVQLHERADIERVKDEVRQAAFWWFKKDHEMYLSSADQLLEKRKAQQQTLTIMLGLIGGISLLVGGIGVMNIMLVSVVERRREIGIRMAVGARPLDIRMMFLCESMVLGLCGGMLGVVTGVGVSWIIAVVEKWSFAFFVWPAVIGFMVSVLVGVFFGYYPAYRASTMDPIVALRTD